MSKEFIDPGKSFGANNADGLDALPILPFPDCHLGERSKITRDEAFGVNIGEVLKEFLKFPDFFASGPAF